MRINTIVFAKPNEGKGGSPSAPPPPPAPPDTAAPSSAFRVSTNLLPPPMTRAGGRGGKSIYPFDTMADPTFDTNGNFTSSASFFVPIKTAKNMASTISSANKRFEKQDKNADGTPKFTEVSGENGAAPTRTAVMVKTKAFRAVNVTQSNDVDAKAASKDGVRIYRIK